MTATADRSPTRFASFLMLTALVAGCGSSSGSAGGGGAIEFTNPDSDVVAVFPAASTADDSVVLLRGESSERAWYLEIIHADGTTTELVQNADGRLVEVNLLGHRFVLSDYTATDVAITHYGPDDSGTTERVALGAANGAQVAATPAALSDEEDSADSLWTWVHEKVKEFADPMNLHPVLIPIKKFIDKGAEKLTRARKKLEELGESAERASQKIGNAWRCKTETRRRCGEEVAEQAPSVAKELRAIDPEGTTSAGFDVSDQGIRPMREEWEVEAQQRTVPLGFTLTDVPCEESVFADMNPDCPQYVPPATSAPGTGPSEPGGNAGTSGGSGGAPGGAGGAAGKDPMNDDSSCRSGMLTSSTGFFWQCSTWREQYSESGNTGEYQQYRETNGLLEDSFGMATRDGKLSRYAVTNHEYDAAGALQREELIISDTATHYRTHEVTTAQGGGWFLHEMHECFETYHRHLVSMRGDDPLTMPSMKISDTRDENFDKCPTVDQVKALVADAFPDVQMTEDFIHASRVYMLHSAAK